jgi:hypothetical protein
MLTGMWAMDGITRDVLLSFCLNVSERQEAGISYAMQRTNDCSGRKGYFLGAQFIRPAGLTGWTLCQPTTGTRAKEALVNSDNPKHKPQSVSYDVNGIRGKEEPGCQRNWVAAKQQQSRARKTQTGLLIHRTGTLITSYSYTNASKSFRWKR